MSNSESASVRESAVVLRSDVFYESEYRELCLQQFGIYQPDKMSISMKKLLFKMYLKKDINLPIKS